MSMKYPLTRAALLMAAVFLTAAVPVDNLPSFSDTKGSNVHDSGMNLTSVRPGVATNAALALAKTTAFPNGVWRDDFSAGFGAPPVFYRPSTVACTLNAGAGDGGAQTASADGKCWNLSPQAGGLYDVRIWGAKVDGVTDDSAAEIAANTAITTLYGGGKIVVPATGHCMVGQNFTGGNAVLGAGVIIKGANVGACLMLKANATGPLFQTPNAYIYMTRRTTGALTQASTSIPVNDSTDILNGYIVYVLDDTGVARSATVNGVPTSNSIPVSAATWSASFTAATGQFIGTTSYPGPPNTGLEDIYLDGNKANQTAVNNNIAASQQLGGAGNLALVGTNPRLTPGSNQLLEFYSPGNLSSLTFTITCTFVRLDQTKVQLTQTLPGPNNGVKRTSTACNSWTTGGDLISVNGAMSAPVTVGAADGTTSLDGVAHFGAMPRYKNVIAENFRGWPFRFKYGPGIGFFTPAPSGSNWQTQEGYIENLQCLNGNAGCTWFDGPNDTRIKSVTANFIYGFGFWFDRLSAGTVADDIHISGGFPDGVTQVEPQVGILSETDSITCRGCKSEEAGINIGILGNNNVFTDFKVFHIDDSTDRIGVLIGDGNYTPAGNLVKAYTLEGKCENMGQGCLYFTSDGGWGRARVTGFAQGAYAGKPAYAGTPALCTVPGSDIELNIVGASVATNPLHRFPCSPFTPTLAFGGSSTGITYATQTGQCYRDFCEFHVQLTSKGAQTGAATLGGLSATPFGNQVAQVCPVNFQAVSNLTGLTGGLKGVMQGAVMGMRQSNAGGDSSIDNTSFTNTADIYGTVGPCILK